MGTELQSPFDLLATKTSNLCEQMEKEVEKRNIEALQKTMLKQEEAFKQQVMELHRLYSVQRMLMDELRNDINKQRSCVGATTTNDKDQYAYAKGNVGFESGIFHPIDLSSSAGPSMIGGELKEDSCGVDLTLSIGSSMKGLKESQPCQESDAKWSVQKSREKEEEASLSMMSSSSAADDNTTG